MKKVIDELIKSRKMTAIYENGAEAGSFHVGVILAQNSDWILECNIGIHGEEDGYSAEKTENIYRVETESLYLRKLEKLSAIKLPDCIKTDDPVEFLLDMAKRKKLVAAVTVREYGNDIFGFIDGYDSELVRMTQLNDMGEYDGETVFLRQEILRLCADDADCRDICCLTGDGNGKTRA